VPVDVPPLPVDVPPLPVDVPPLPVDVPPVPPIEVPVEEEVDLPHGPPPGVGPPVEVADPAKDKVPNAMEGI
jgi:hypothetical protein